MELQQMRDANMASYPQARNRSIIYSPRLVLRCDASFRPERAVFRPLPSDPSFQQVYHHHVPIDSTRSDSPTTVMATLSSSPSTAEFDDAQTRSEVDNSASEDTVPDPIGDLFRADTWYQEYNRAFLATPSVDRGTVDPENRSVEDSSDDEVEIVAPHAYAPPEVYSNPSNEHDGGFDSEVEVMSFTHDRDDDDSSCWHNKVQPN